ncbi:hypothetical protein VTN00DRAFT_3586 [Thermoascus crustaceus]|uniref:uncharacterized protein n=1 Tax=Thermoascus crustaceus TaxID=5088 RepID=UPI003744AB37
MDGWTDSSLARLLCFALFCLVRFDPVNEWMDEWMDGWMDSDLHYITWKDQILYFRSGSGSVARPSMGSVRVPSSGFKIMWSCYRIEWK